VSALAWARDNAEEYGADPSVVFVAGSSAGAHIAATTAHAELPKGLHNFDLFHSIRFEILIDGIEAFTAWVRSRSTTSD
jgi:acetyl esterase/lipase